MAEAEALHIFFLVFQLRVSILHDALVYVIVNLNLSDIFVYW